VKPCTKVDARETPKSLSIEGNRMAFYMVLATTTTPTKEIFFKFQKIK